MNLKRKIELYEKNKNKLSFFNIMLLIFTPITLSLFFYCLSSLSLINVFSFTCSFMLFIISIYIRYNSNKNINLILKKIKKDLIVYNKELIIIDVRKLIDNPSSNFIRLNGELYYRVNDGILTIYKNESQKLLRVI